MADTKITGLTALTTPAAADLIAVVDDVGGTPTTKKVTLADLLGNYIEGAIDLSDTSETLTNKTIDSASNTLTLDLGEGTLTGTTAEFNTALQDGSFATLAGTETLTNKTIDSASNTLTLDLGEGTLTGTTAEFNTALQDGSFATLAGSESLTNKTINGDNNTITNLDIGNEVDWAAATDVTDASAFASGDKILIFEDGVGMRKIDYDDLPGAGGGLSNIVEDTTPQLGGDLDANGNDILMADSVISRAKLEDYGETVNALGDLGGGTDAINLESGNVVTATVSTSTQTFTFTNPPASGTAGSFTLILTNGGSQTVNWPASVNWAGGSAPTLTTSGVDILTFLTTDGGTTWYGFPAGLDMS